MLTPTLIKVLKKDTTLRSLLGASSEDTVPIQASFVMEPVVDKYIAVDVLYGESEHTGYEHGLISINICVKGSVQGPIEVCNSLAERVIALLNMKGSTLTVGLSGDVTNIYRLRKMPSEIQWDSDSGLYVLPVSFEFYITS